MQRLGRRQRRRPLIANGDSRQRSVRSDAAGGGSGTRRPDEEEGSDDSRRPSPLRRGRVGGRNGANSTGTTPGRRGNPITTTILSALLVASLLMTVWVSSRTTSRQRRSSSSPTSAILAAIVYNRNPPRPGTSSASQTTSGNYQQQGGRRPATVLFSPPPPPHEDGADASASLFENDGRLEKIPLYLAPDYGGLEIVSLSPSMTTRKKREFRRAVVSGRDATGAAERHRREVLQRAEDNHVSDRFTHFDDLDPDRECIRPAWTYRYFPVCNTFHELPPLELPPNTMLLRQQQYDYRYLAHGYYRDSWLLENPAAAGDGLVLKRLRTVHEHDARMMLKVNTEALLLERLTASPVIINSHGLCSTSLLVEKAEELTHDIVPHDGAHQRHRGRIRRSRLDRLQRDGVHPFNSLTPPEKLGIAISMAEGLAEQHGHAGGAVVNDDVDPGQWLVTGDGRVVLNDLNNAMFLEYSPKNRSYCKYWTSYGGNFRAPEEYREGGAYVDETVDIYPFGNVIYSLLTGLWPFPFETDSERIQEMAAAGARPDLDPRYRERSLIERRLAEIMDRCLELEPADRADIFQVLQHLYETRRLHEREERRERMPPQANVP